MGMKFLDFVMTNIRMDEAKRDDYDGTNVRRICVQMMMAGRRFGINTVVRGYDPHGTGMNADPVRHPQDDPDDDLEQMYGVEITDFFAKNPGSGGGSKAMMEICAIADRTLTTIYLLPSSPRNVIFYARFGFERSKTSNGMLVRPLDPKLLGYQLDSYT